MLAGRAFLARVLDERLEAEILEAGPLGEEMEMGSGGKVRFFGYIGGGRGSGEGVGREEEEDKE